MDNANIHGADAMIAKLKAIQHYIEHDVKTVVGVEGVRVFKENFTNEGNGKDKWKPRSSARVGNTNSQRVLSKSGELKDSIDFRVEGSDVIFYSDKPYAQIHNEGGVIKVTEGMRRFFWAMFYMAKEAGDEGLMLHWKYMALAKEMKIPQRQFLGPSDILMQRIIDKILRDLTKIINS